MDKKLNLPEEFQKDIRRCVEILKEEGCGEVYLFGSLADGCFTGESDLDIAIRGCPVGNFFHIYGRLMDELEHQFDLVKLDGKDPFGKFLVDLGDMIKIG